MKFEEDCAKEAVNLSKKYLLNSKLPDKAIDLLDETAASVKINEKNKSKLVNSNDIKETISGLQIFQQVQLNQTKKLSSKI